MHPSTSSVWEYLYLYGNIYYKCPMYFRTKKVQSIWTVRKNVFVESKREYKLLPLPVFPRYFPTAVIDQMFPTINVVTQNRSSCPKSEKSHRIISR